MLQKTKPEIIEAYFSDHSYLSGGNADGVFFPESIEDISTIITEANLSKTPITIAGAGTGTTGGRIPFGGNVLSMEKLVGISIGQSSTQSPEITVQGGTSLKQIDDYLKDYQLFYPPDPTETSAFIGATIANNSSGACTFKYGSTRDWVSGLTVVLPTGRILDLHLGQELSPFKATCTATVTKSAAGYYSDSEQDLVDLFIGSEGTLGVIISATLAVLPRPKAKLALYLFLKDENSALALAKVLRAQRVHVRPAGRESVCQTFLPDYVQYSGIDPLCVEYFDPRALNMLRKTAHNIPDEAEACLYIEQWNQTGNALEAWDKLLAHYQDVLTDIWCAESDKELENLKAIRHGLPVAINETIAQLGYPKVSMDFAVPESCFAEIYKTYQELFSKTKIQWLTFGHIGDCHLHVNLLPKDVAQYDQAQQLYKQLAQQVIDLGGTISAEHGIGKLKHELLEMMVGQQTVAAMRRIKREFDPQNILNINNIFRS